MRMKLGLGMLAAALSAVAAKAQDNIQGLETIGIPSQDGLNFQPATTELMRDILWFDNFLLYYITAIVVLVTVLMLYVFIRYNSKANPEPATFTHNTPLEVTWIVIPALSLVIIALFMSLPILFKQLDIPEADVRITCVSRQPAHNGIGHMSIKITSLNLIR